MNYLPFCGYWFYGMPTAKEMALSFSSYGLLSPTSPVAGISRRGKWLITLIKRIKR